MDKHYVKNIIDGLKSSSSSCVQQTLLKIRSKVIVNDNGIQLFRECGGLDQLIPHLRKPNERILDLTLSILGNCCLEEKSSLAVSYINSKLWCKNNYNRNSLYFIVCYFRSANYMLPLLLYTY